MGTSGRRAYKVGAAVDTDMPPRGSIENKRWCGSLVPVMRETTTLHKVVVIQISRFDLFYVSFFFGTQKYFFTSMNVSYLKLSAVQPQIAAAA